MSRTTTVRTTRTARRLGAALTGGALVLALTAAPALATGPSATTGSTATVPSDAASDDPSGGTVTVTVDAAALARLCDDRVPQVTRRARAVLDRIQGDAGTAGSAAWLGARADRAASEGHDDLARRLTFRSEQRLGHVDEIAGLLDRLAAFEANVCSQVAP
jgi:hypothetical protein